MLLPIKRETLIEYVFISFLVISQIYYGYRYILQYNSTATSPTYSDTPFLFQVGKYVIALFILYLMIPTFLMIPLSGLKKRSNPLNTNLWVVWFFLILYTGYVSISSLKFVSITQDIKGLFFMPLILLMPYFYRGESSLKLYLKIGLWGLIYHIAYSIFQVSNYIFFDRLPALGWPGTLARFGGGWDDPNGFGMFLILPILLLLELRNRFSNTWRRYSYALLMVLILLVLLTVSITAISMLILALFLYGIFRNRKSLLIFFTLLGLTGVLFCVNPVYVEYIKTIYMWKSESITAHLSGMTQLTDFVANSSVFSLLVGQNSEWVFNENFYIQIFINYGLLGLFLLFSSISLSLIYGFAKVRLARKYGDGLTEGVLVALLIYAVVFIVGSVGIPFYSVFPTNLFFWLAIAITVLTPVGKESVFANV